MTSTSRIQFDELPDDLQTRLRARVQRLGYLGEFFQVGAHQPVALAGFIDYTEALKDALPHRLVETIALTAATATDNSYERVQHERLALTLGFSEAEVRALVTPDGSLEAFSPAERAAGALAREVCAARGAACPAYGELETLVGEDVAVGCLMTAVRYLAHATMANTWGLAPPVPSPLTGAAPGG